MERGSVWCGGGSVVLWPAWSWTMLQPEEQDQHAVVVPNAGRRTVSRLITHQYNGVQKRSEHHVPNHAGIRGMGTSDPPCVDVDIVLRYQYINSLNSCDYLSLFRISGSSLYAFDLHRGEILFLKANSLCSASKHIINSIIR